MSEPSPQGHKEWGWSFGAGLPLVLTFALLMFGVYWIDRNPQYDLDGGGDMLASLVVVILLAITAVIVVAWRLWARDNAGLVWLGLVAACLFAAWALVFQSSWSS